jgi:SAM-dependent methyltransferase
MVPLYKPFLDLIPAGGRILDAGCGSGRDSKAFLDRGYSVLSIDASSKMVSATTELTGQQAVRLSLQDIKSDSEFDGIWACASLLHVPFTELPDTFFRLARALRPSGVIYASFKAGTGERQQGGRLFSDMNESSIGELLAGIDDLEIAELWHTGDLRPDHSDKWLNLLLQGRTS